MCLIAWCAKLILLPSVSLFLPTLLLTHPESACDSLLCVRGWMGFRGVQFLVAPVTPLSHGFMMHLPVSKAITPLSNPTEKLKKKKDTGLLSENNTQEKTKKSLLTHAALFDPSKTLSNKKTRIQTKQAGSVCVRQLIEKQRQMSLSSRSWAYRTVSFKASPRWMSPGQNIKEATGDLFLFCRHHCCD